MSDRGKFELGRLSLSGLRKICAGGKGGCGLRKNPGYLFAHN
jgi:hypothetical protein